MTPSPLLDGNLQFSPSLMDPNSNRQELYDMHAFKEPGAAPPEYDNVLGAQPEVAAKLRSLLLNWKASLDPENVTWTVQKPGCVQYPYP